MFFAKVNQNVQIDHFPFATICKRANEREPSSLDVIVENQRKMISRCISFGEAQKTGLFYRLLFLQVTRRIYKGIPDSLRGVIWSKLLDIERMKQEQSGVYEVRLLFVLLCFKSRSFCKTLFRAAYFVFHYLLIKALLTWYDQS